MHGAKDDHFPGYGAQIAAWWARCNQCDRRATRGLANGCIAWATCARGAPTVYCEGTGDHGTWPGLNDTLVRFFVEAR